MTNRLAQQDKVLQKYGDGATDEENADARPVLDLSKASNEPGNIVQKVRSLLKNSGFPPYLLDGNDLIIGDAIAINEVTQTVGLKAQLHRNSLGVDASRSQRSIKTIVNQD